uniref:Uncharacterized protein n=1 Tax=Arundo donax TaxID=35708 RepID=A0A0A9G3C4_ARUDO
MPYMNKSITWVQTSNNLSRFLVKNRQVSYGALQVSKSGPHQRYNMDCCPGNS